MSSPAAGRALRYGASEEEKARYHGLARRHGTPLLVVSRERLRVQYRDLQKRLPDVSLYYAIKAFPHPAVIETLAALGCHFDVASEGEIELLQALRISGRKTIHTHPVKKSQQIKAALRGGSTTFVVDNLEELGKLTPWRHRVGILIRLSFPSETAAVDLSRKFGCPPEEAPEIAERAQRAGFQVRGLSFHVGSQSLSPQAHVDAIEQCRRLLERINERLPHPLGTLDIGGGFPVDYELRGFDYDAYFQPIRRALERLPRDLHLIAEPGRYLVAPAVISISSVIGKSRRGGLRWYYLDDGIYGSYSGQLFDHARYPLQFPDGEGPRSPSVLAGPTCDSIDVIAENLDLPELNEGDLVIGRMMGAYTAATSTRFNSLNAAKIVVEEEDFDVG